MFGFLVVVLVLGVPVAALCSLWAGVRIFGHNKVLAGLIIVGAVASGLSLAWEWRFDIDLIGDFLDTLGIDTLDSYDPSDYFVTLYALVSISVLLARFRWKPEYGSPLALNLALIFWPMAGVPYLLLSPGMFAP